MTTSLTYLVQAFDAHHNGLDTDPENRGEGYPTTTDGPREMLAFIATTQTGTLHDFDADTHTTRRIAYWVISWDGVPREVYTTAWGRSCTRCMATLPKRGPGCREPRPIPTI